VSIWLVELSSHIECFEDRRFRCSVRDSTSYDRVTWLQHLCLIGRAAQLTHSLSTNDCWQVLADLKGKCVEFYPGGGGLYCILCIKFWWILRGTLSMGHLSPPLSIWQVLVDLMGNCVDGTSAPPLSKCLLASSIGLKGNCVDGSSLLSSLHMILAGYGGFKGELCWWVTCPLLSPYDSGKFWWI
jgi:hypothetical protein